MKPLRPRPGPGISERVPLRDVLKLLGKPDLVIAPSGSAFSTATCHPCDLKQIIDTSARSATLVNCDSARDKRKCFEEARSTQSTVVVHQTWNGIDSGGNEVLVGTPDSVRSYRYDRDVTGGTEPECCAAVFSTICISLVWANGSYTCDGVHVTECSEWNNQRTTLHDGLPAGDRSCGFGSCKEGAPLLCRRHKDGRFSCSPR